MTDKKLPSKLEDLKSSFPKWNFSQEVRNIKCTGAEFPYILEAIMVCGYLDTNAFFRIDAAVEHVAIMAAYCAALEFEEFDDDIILKGKP